MAVNAVWGVDIGNSAIKAIRMVRRDKDEVRIVDFDIVDIQNSDDDSDRASRVQAALGTLVGNHDFGKDPIFLSLPGNLCLFREFQLPPGSESKLQELVQYEAKQQIPFPLDQVEMAWEKYEDPSGAGVGVQMIVVRKNIIEEHLAMTDQFHLNIVGISVAPVALFNFINYEFQPSGANLILDAGHRSTDFVVVRDRHMYSRTIQIAGRELTRVLENKFKVPFEKAEDLKRNIGQSKQAEKILTVIEPTLRQLTSEIQRTIGFYKSKTRGQKLSHSYLLGHTFRLPTVAEHLASNIPECPFTIVEGVRRIQLDRQINPDVFANEFPTMAVAIGLGLQGLDLSDWKANLLPRERIREIEVGQKKIWGWVSAAAILLTLIATYVTSNRQRDYFTKLDQEIKGTLDDINTIKRKLAKETQGVDFRTKQLQRLARIGHDRGKILQAFQMVADLKDPTSGGPLWGNTAQPAEKRLYLTNLGVSRIPFEDKLGANLKETELDNERKSKLKESTALKGSESFYKDLKDAGDLDKVAPELQPDLPLIVIVSGECHGDMFEALQMLEAAITKQIPGATVHDTKERLPRKTRVEITPRYSIKGEPIPGQPTHEGANTITYTPFHLMFRWNNPQDPDIVPNAKPDKNSKTNT